MLYVLVVSHIDIGLSNITSKCIKISAHSLRESMPFTLAKLLTCRNQLVSRQATSQWVVIILTIAVTVLAMRYVDKLQTAAVQEVVY
jgi:hypothetical protein